MARRPFFFFFLICTALAGKAQPVVFGGPQATSAKYTVRGRDQATGTKWGFMAGLGTKISFEPPLYFFPAVYYSLKGYTVTFTDAAFPPTEFAKNNNTTIHTIEVAPLFQVDLSKKPSHLFVRFGPAVDFALSGRERFDTVSTTGVTGSVDRKMRFAFTEYGQITASANLHFGYETGSGLMVFAHYAYGIGSMNNNDDGPRILHRIGGVGVGWRFMK